MIGDVLTADLWPWNFSGDASFCPLYWCTLTKFCSNLFISVVSKLIRAQIPVKRHTYQNPVKDVSTRLQASTYELGFKEKRMGDGILRNLQYGLLFIIAFTFQRKLGLKTHWDVKSTRICFVRNNECLSLSHIMLFLVWCVSCVWCVYSFILMCT